MKILKKIFHHHGHRCFTYIYLIFAEYRLLWLNTNIILIETVAFEKIT